MKVVTILANGDRAISSQELVPYGIEIVGCAKSHQDLAERNGNGGVDAALVSLDGMGPDERREAVGRLTSQEICVVGMTSDTGAAGLCELLDDGVEGLVGLASGAPDVARTLWSAQRRFVARRALQQELESLQRSLKNRKVIEQAKAIIAELRGITESEALRHLRREARNRRRSMHELAQVLIEARQILEPAGRGEGAGSKRGDGD